MISEESTAAEEAKMIIDTLEPISPDAPSIVETLRRAYDQARPGLAQGLSSEVALNDIRNEVVLALNEIIGSLQARTLTEEKINKAKASATDGSRF